MTTSSHLWVFTNSSLNPPLANHSKMWHFRLLLYNLLKITGGCVCFHFCFFPWNLIEYVSLLLGHTNKC